MTTALAVVVDVTIVSALALLVCHVMRRRPAALRHAILAASLAAAGAAPVFESALPRWELAVLSRAQPVVSSEPMIASEVASSPVDVTAASVPEPPKRSWATAIGAVWAIGFLVVITGLGAGLGRLVRMTRLCRPVHAKAWKEHVEGLSIQCALKRRVLMLESDDRAPLLTWGLFRPRIIVPAAALSWTAERIEIVLAHELAHIARRDWALQIGAEVVRAVYWFNPLIWIVCRRLRDEAEQACDDDVLRRGVDPADYASHLLAVAREAVTNGRDWTLAPAVASASTLERRIAVILNARRNREPLTLAARVLTCVAVLVAMVPVSAMTLTERVEATPADPVALGDITLSPPALMALAASAPAPELAPAPATVRPLKRTSREQARPDIQEAERAAREAAETLRQAQQQLERAQAAAPAQQGTSSLSGTLRDASGGVLPGVAVTLTNAASGISLSAVTDPTGAFRFRGLQPLQYELVARLPGFASVSTTVFLTSAQDLQRDIEMRIGGLLETVTVTCGSGAAALAENAAVMAFGMAAVGSRLFTRPGATRDVRPLLAAQGVPVRVGGQIMAPRRIKDVKPACPPVPPAATGMVVILEGAVGADGLIKELVPLRPKQADEAGFVRAAMDAVRQWEFTPVRLNNVPTAVIMTVTVTFVPGRP